MLTSQDIQAAADRLAKALNPEKIILFGSYARGEANEHSDLDFMVVEPQGMKLFEAIVSGRKAVGRMGVGVDILAYDRETFECRKDWCASPIHWAEVEGKVLYERSE